MLGKTQYTKADQAGDSGHEHSGAHQQIRWVVGIAVPLVTIHRIHRIIITHAKNDNGQHQAGNVQRMSNEFQGTQGADKGKKWRQQDKRSQTQIQGKKQVKKSHQGNDQPQSLQEVGKEDIPQTFGKIGPVKDLGRSAVTLKKAGRLIQATRLQADKLHMATLSTCGRGHGEQPEKSWRQRWRSSCMVR